MASIINQEDFANVMKFPSREIFNKYENSGCAPSVVNILNGRQTGLGAKCKPPFLNYQLKQFIEMKAVRSEMSKRECDIPNSSRSTFLMQYSNDCTKVASTHWNNNIYICDVKTGKRLKTLEGHTRTPWAVVFHPTCNEILASGCLAGEVRVWDLQGRCKKWKIDNAINSLAFHPFYHILVIAAGNALYFWDWAYPRPFAYCCTSTAFEKVRFNNEQLITGIAISPYDRILRKSGDRTPTSRSLRIGLDGESHTSSQHETTHNRTGLFQIDSSDDSDSSDSDTSDFGVYKYYICCVLPHIISAVLEIYESINSTCRALQAFIENFLQENSQAAQLIDIVSAHQSHEPGPSTTERTALEVFIDEVTNIREFIGQSNVSQQSSFELHYSLVQISVSLCDLRTEAENLSSHGINIADIMDCLEILRRKRNRLITLAGAIPNVSYPPMGRRNRSRYRSVSATPYRRRSRTPHPNTLRLRFRSRATSAAAATSARGQNANLANAAWENSNPFRRMMINSPDNSSQFSSSVNSGHLHEENNSSDSAQETSQRFKVSDNTRNVRLRRSFTSHPIIPKPSVLHSGRNQLPHSPSTVIARVVSPSEDNLWLVATHENSPSLITPESSSSQYPVSSLTSESVKETEIFTQRNNSSVSPPEASQHSSCSNKDNKTPGEMTLNYHTYQTSDQINRRRKSTQSEPHVAKRQHIYSTVIPTDGNASENTAHEIASNCSVEGSSSDLSSQFESAFPRNYSTAQEILEKSDITDISMFVRPFNSRRSVVCHPCSFDPGNTPSTSRSFLERDAFYVNSFPNNNNDDDTMDLHYIDVESSDDNDIQVDSAHVANMSSDDDPIDEFEGLNVARSQLIVDHRIQAWDFSKLTLPAIHDAEANIVVKKCMIHNDASVDISKDGEKLIAFLPAGSSDSKIYRFGLFSLNKETLGDRLCLWGFINDPVSLSFSPLGQYVAMGSAAARYWRLESTVIIDIIKLCPQNDRNDEPCHAQHIRGFSRSNSLDIRYTDIRLNCVKFLPEVGAGLAYATNRGTLSICEPKASINKPDTQVVFDPRILSADDLDEVEE